MHIINIKELKLATHPFMFARDMNGGEDINNVLTNARQYVLEMHCEGVSLLSWDCPIVCIQHYI